MKEIVEVIAKQHGTNRYNNGKPVDMSVMQDAIDILKEFGISAAVDIVSAHRTPDKLMDYGKEAHKKGVKVIIAGAGGAAHLPGMIAALSPLPVIGVPVKSSNSIDGWDSVLSILNARRCSCSNSSTQWCQERRNSSSTNIRYPRQ